LCAPMCAMKRKSRISSTRPSLVFGRLDIAVNNAGTVGNPGSAADVTPETYQAIFDTNVLGVLLCMKYEIRAMLGQGKGSIVNISSSYGKVGGLRQRCMSAANMRWRASRSLQPSNSPAQVFVSTSLAPDRRKRGSTICADEGKQSKFPRGTHSYQAHGNARRDCKCHRVHWL
jgi:NAD(P)-dependent dehydrogenase (short-subunit alcohol dehydrogenase family)